MILAKELREAVLQSAFEGKLVKSNKSDTSVQIALNTNNIFTTEDYPYNIPESWKWVKFGDVSTYSKTKKKINAKDADNEAWMLDLEDIEKGGRLLCKKRVQDKIAIGDKTIFHKGNLLYSKLRPYLLKVLIADEEGICTPELVPFDMLCNINSRYVEYYLKSPYVDYEINKVTYGVKMPRVGTETMINLCFPFPPIEEQERIVAKVDELMAKIDEYEEIENKLNDLKLKFPGDMKDAILQSAMQGKLTEHIKNDSYSMKIYESIKKINSKCKIYDLEDNPKSWIAMKLSDICDIYTGNSIPESIKANKYAKCIDGYDYIGTKDVEFNNSIKYNNGIKIPYDEPNFKYADKDSILLCIEGGSAGRKIGILDRKVCFGNKLCKFSSNYVNSKFIYYFLQSPMFINEFKSNLSGIIGGVSINKIKQLVIPIPPIEEQQRIVDKLDQLLPLIDELKLNN